MSVCESHAAHLGDHDEEDVPRAVNILIILDMSKSSSIIRK